MRRAPRPAAQRRARTRARTRVARGVTSLLQPCSVARAATGGREALGAAGEAGNRDSIGVGSLPSFRTVSLCALHSQLLLNHASAGEGYDEFRLGRDVVWQKENVWLYMWCEGARLATRRRKIATILRANLRAISTGDPARSGVRCCRFLLESLAPWRRYEPPRAVPSRVREAALRGLDHARQALLDERRRREASRGVMRLNCACRYSSSPATRRGARARLPLLARSGPLR